MLTSKQKVSVIGYNQKIDYKDVDLLKNFIGHNENGTFVEQMVNWMYWFFMAISFIALSSFSIYHFLIEPYFAQ